MFLIFKKYPNEYTYDINKRNSQDKILGYIDNIDKAIEYCSIKNKKYGEKTGLDYCRIYSYRKVEMIV